MSTAAELVNDPTVRKCIEFARRNGYGTLVVCNVYAYRSTDPRGLKLVDDPVGPGNDTCLNWLRDLPRVVAAWGKNAEPDRAARAVEIVKNLDCLGVNKDGSPKHPLYVPYATPFTPYARDGKRVARPINELDRFTAGLREEARA